ncbi:SDR family NAD(P)-dependent oxidoreductase [Halorarius litoreus]|uniref:SDR family NAD(P)-dependent oxidoreductase n=1 Tax=Halorarius litoreus TaxID=2962676 RepID=UPI0020CF46BC|nr:SDR family NAD(P)-dependent oxidoreductase [Halorarius litoreus]
MPRTVLVTGATSGIGRVAAERLGERGWRVLVHGRNRERGERVVDAIESAGSEAVFHRADFADVDAVRNLAATVREEPRLDALVNNAALSVNEYREAEGVELTLAVNHLAPYLLTHELLPLLRESAPARVVVTASGVHFRGEIDPENLSMPDYDALDAYARSKLANVLFAVELASRLDPAAVTANAYHPGFVPDTGLYRDSSLPVRLATRLASLVPGVGTSTAAGADGLVYLTDADDVADVTGAYFARREREEPDSRAHDTGLRERLWDVSADLVGVDPDWP